LSVLHQSISRDTYEIICVIGFTDNELSAFIKQNGITEIFCDGSFCDCLVNGIKHCCGNIVVFLDDDDVFRQDKLKNVITAFKQTKCVYYHNNVDFIDSNSSKILKPPSPYDKQVKDQIIWYPPKGWNNIVRQRVISTYKD
jgi:hypothetical protein